MPSVNAYEELDFGIEMLLSGEEPDIANGEIGELLAIADDLRFMPDAEFKMALMEELERVAVAGNGPTLSRPARDKGRAPVVSGETAPPYPLKSADKGRAQMGGHANSRAEEEVILPSLFGAGVNAYPVHRGSFVASYMGQAAMLALIATSGFWMVQHRTDIQQQLGSAIQISEYALPPATDASHGGGGAGTKDKFEASKGALPKTSREQIAPPLIVIRSSAAKLEVEPTVVAPQLNIPQVGPLGDPMSHVLGPASNGTGSGSGIGSGTGTGVGSGSGPGVGPGNGGGAGDGWYTVGGGVTSPVPIFDPDPEYSEEARKLKQQGVVVLWVVIGVDGRPKQMKVQQSLGMGLDEKAIEAVSKWRFKPAMRDGKPVPVAVNVEVSFRLY